MLLKTFEFAAENSFYFTVVVRIKSWDFSSLFLISHAEKRTRDLKVILPFNLGSE